MYLNNLFEKISGLPYKEQQLFIKMNILLIESYKYNVKNNGEADAIKKLYDLYDYLEQLNKNNDNLDKKL